MPEPTNRAVFLSYASQDAEAVRRIADALRASGVEAWFDADGGLEHGDEWDAKIRRQIKECVLFIPVISANTQAREEGYFRIEWDLAAERARGIASGVPFILPVVIDGTAEPDALVPDRFRMVQWTRLRGGEVPPEVLQRFLKLWSHRTGVLKHEASRAGAAPVHAALSPAEAIGRPGAKHYAFIAAAIAAIVVGIGWWLLGGRSQSVAPSTPAPAVAPGKPVPAPAPLSEARQLAEKARAIFDALEGTREDYKLAEELITQAKAKDAADAEVYAAEAQLHERFIQRGWDSSTARREAARIAVQRAVRLDPQSFEARFAQAFLLRPTDREGEERVRQLRELRRERPTDQRVLRSLATTLDRLGRYEEGVPIYRESAALPGGDPLALYSLSQSYWFAGRANEAEKAMEEAIAQKPFGSALLMISWYKTTLRGDLAGARKIIEQMDPAFMHEDRGGIFAFVTEYYARNPDQAIAWLQGVPRDWLSDSWYSGPKGLLVGDAHQLAGRAAAATLEWQTALALVDQRLVEQPKSPSLLGNRVLLLARLGQREKAESQFSLMLQLAGVDLARLPGMRQVTGRYLIALGRYAEALSQLRDFIRNDRRWAVICPSATLRLDPLYDPLRADPEFARIIAEVEAREKANAPGDPASTGTSALPKVDDKSVAVLAFANLSDEKANEYFSDGVSEELLTVLQKIPGLRVAARTSAFSFKGRSATAQEIGATLGVANLVEGSVRRAGNAVRIIARLSRAATGEQVWSESYTRDLKDVFAVQSELAQTIVGELRGHLGGESTLAQVRAAIRGGTTDTEAYQQYWQGRFLMNQFSLENLAKATACFERAVTLDPKFALAWAAQARSRSMHAGWADRLTREQFDAELAEARRCADRALALDADLPEALTARFELQFSYDFDWKGGAATNRRARELAPSDPQVLGGAVRVAGVFGDRAGAIALARQAVALDPVNAEVRVYLGTALLQDRQWAEARKEFARVAELSPTTPWAYAGVALADLYEGKFAEALAAAEGEKAEFARLLVSAIALWGLHRTAEADAALAKMIELDADVGAFQIAEAYAARGDKDQAFAWLDRARRQRDAGLAVFSNDAFFDFLRSDPRWAAFQRQLGLAPEQLQ